MFKIFIEEVNFIYSSGIRSTDKLSYLLNKKFGKEFVKKRLSELEFLINYQPFSIIDFLTLERSIIKYLTHNPSFKRLIETSNYINGTHILNVPDKKTDLETLNLLGYLDMLQRHNGRLHVLYDFFKENQVEPRRLSIEEFQKIQQYKAELGERGEEYVFNLEIRRLPGMPVKKMSTEDIQAGYDILSYKTPNNLTIENYLMLEIKTFQESFTFFVSNNEYQTHVENRGRHNFVIVREDGEGNMSIYKVIEDLQSYMEANPTVVTLIPTFKFILE
jgi:hypothetical protein